MDGYVYECAITPSSCSALTSSAGTLRVNTLTAATVNSPTICAAANTTLTVTPTNTGTATLSYQWLLSTNNGSTFATIGNSGVYTGATTATLTLTNAPNTMDGYVYECAITPSSCSALTSSAGTLRVNSLTAATVNSPTICAAANTTLTVTPTNTGTATLAYQWLLSTNNGSTFATIGNAGVYTGATTGHPYPYQCAQYHGRLCL